MEDPLPSLGEKVFGEKEGKGRKIKGKKVKGGSFLNCFHFIAQHLGEKKIAL